MNTQINEVKSNSLPVSMQSNKPAEKVAPKVTAEAPKAEKPKVEAKPAEKVIKETPVDERKYELVDVKTEQKFRGKQRQIIYTILHASTVPLSAKEITPLATAAGLTATGGVEPSVKYHLHHMTKDGITKVVNPTIVIE